MKPSYAAASPIKCPYCDLTVESKESLEHHITYTDRPNHPKIVQYLKEQKNQNRELEPEPKPELELKKEHEEQVSDSYYYSDSDLLKDSEYIKARDSLYPQYVLELRRDGGALRIKQTSVAVLFNPEDPAQTYQDLLKAVLGLDKEFSDDPKLWEFTQRDLRYKLKRIYTNKDRREEEAVKEQERQAEVKKEESKRETKVRQLVEKLEKKYRFASMEDTGEIFYYHKKNGRFEPAEPLVKTQLEKLQPGVITDTVNNVIQKLARRHLYPRDAFDKDKYIINMENGLYDIRTKKLNKHTWRYLSRNQIPVKYDPKARCTRFGKFLSEVVYTDQIRAVVEVMAYTFLRDNPFELYVILLGVGSNGKSVLMHILTKLHGNDNVSGTPLTSLLNNRFAKKELEGKNVNIDMEMSKATINDMGILKELTGQQPVRIEPKHLPAYTTRLWAKLFFSTNEMPEMMDFSDGHYRREVIISFPYQFEEVRTPREKADIELAIKTGSNKRVADPTLKDKLTTPEELSGIFNALMIPLQKIVTENKPLYMDAKSIEERRKKHEIIVDPVRAFFAEATEYDQDGKVHKDKLYVAYRRFCKHHKLPVEGMENFGRLVKRKFTELKETRDSSEERKTMWKGINLMKWANSDVLQDILTV
jgi:P4 family phage/plasmid primase-like protien